MASLVTGASGFIGRELCRQLLADGEEVVALARHDFSLDEARCITHDLTQKPIPRDLLSGVDTVYHLAGVAHAWGLPEAVYQAVNVEATRRLLAAAVAAGVRRFVYFSSVKAMGEPQDDRCVDETHEVPPRDAYGRSKREAEDIVLHQAAIAGMHAVILRPALVYGPGVKGNLARIIRLAHAGWCLPVPETGNRRSMVHVTDLCRAACLAARTPAANGARLIVADGQPVSTRMLFDAVCRASGRRPPAWSVPVSMLRLAGRAADFLARLSGRRLPLGREEVSRMLDSACYDATRCCALLSWKPERDVLSSVPEMVAAWRKENGIGGP